MERSSGILCHITSIPGPYGIGDFYREARNFADFLAGSGVGYWQILPLNPTDTRLGNSPFSSSSAFALSPLLISPDRLVESGYLDPGDLVRTPAFPADRTNYGRVAAFKIPLLYQAYQRFRQKRRPPEFEQFCLDHHQWLEDFSIFVCLKARFGSKSWHEWPPGARDRRERELNFYRQDLREMIEREKFIQWQAYSQWHELKGYCSERGLQVIGDIPIYIDYESADVWSHPGLFKLDRSKKPRVVAGVPPDYFSETGQVWGNPVFNWKAMEAGGFEWWIQRIENNLKLFDMIRVDHFRGFVACWEIPAGQSTAEKGRWIDAAGEKLFKALSGKLKDLPLIAEDLGEITRDVRDFLARTGLPGMRVLQFGLMSGDGKDEHLPHHHPANSVAYTGTHDNNTLRGWYKRELNGEGRKFLNAYTGKRITLRKVHREVIRLGMMSPARIFIFPMQDVLGLGRKARMNIPSVPAGNWEWRFARNLLKPSLKRWIWRLNELYGRNFHLQNL